MSTQVAPVANHALASNSLSVQSQSTSFSAYLVTVTPQTGGVAYSVAPLGGFGLVGDLTGNTSTTDPRLELSNLRLMVNEDVVAYVNLAFDTDFTNMTATASVTHQLANGQTFAFEGQIASWANSAA